MDGASHGLGVMLPMGPVEAGRWHEAPAAFAALEQVGSSAIWITDHLFWGVEVPEALTFAAVAASATTRCAIGVGVLQLPLRRTAAVAKAAATIQSLSNGRFHLGVGAGEHEEEYRRSGVEFSTRGASLDTGLDQLRALWKASEGRYAQLPVSRPIPLWVGGRSAAAMRRAARCADGWLPIFVGPERFAAQNRQLDELLAGAGRESSSVRRGVVVLVSVPGRRWTDDDALGWASRLWGTHPDALARHLVCGSPDEVVDRLGEYIAAGADHVAILPATTEPLPMVEILNERFIARSEPLLQVQ